ncbi:MAG: Translation initiation factor 2, partial [uncultured Solirubrobacteraceae bacterium]
GQEARPRASQAVRHAVLGGAQAPHGRGHRGQGRRLGGRRGGSGSRSHRQAAPPDSQRRQAQAGRRSARRPADRPARPRPAAAGAQAARQVRR